MKIIRQFKYGIDVSRNRAIDGSPIYHIKVRVGAFSELGEAKIGDLRELIFDPEEETLSFEVSLPHSPPQAKEKKKTKESNTPEGTIK